MNEALFTAGIRGYSWFMESLRSALVSLAVLTMGCSLSPTSPAATSPEATSAPASPPPSPSAATEPPVRARFVDLPTEIPDAPCHQVLLAVVSGEGTFAGEKLGAGDTVVVMNPAATRVEGAGLAVLVDHPAPPERCVVKTLPATEKKILRGASAPPLTWGKGAMTARLDVTSDLSPHLYLGRLEGTAPVKEHDHPTSWEILCAVEATGTFTLDGVEKRLGPRQIVVVPAGKKHAWQPDPGSKLVGIQLYVPPGPEQRFKALAAAETAVPPSR